MWPDSLFHLLGGLCRKNDCLDSLFGRFCPDFGDLGGLYEKSHLRVSLLQEKVVPGKEKYSIDRQYTIIELVFCYRY